MTERPPRSRLTERERDYYTEAVLHLAITDGLPLSVTACRKVSALVVKRHGMSETTPISLLRAELTLYYWEHLGDLD